MVGEDRSEVVRALVNKLPLSDGSIVTLYWGLDTQEEEARTLVEQLEKDHLGIELEMVYGGQPYYDYIISAE